MGSYVLIRDGKTLKTDERYTLQNCKDNHGLQIDKVWYESFEGLDTFTENYIRNMIANGEKINNNPRIVMSTIHGAKGIGRRCMCGEKGSSTRYIVIPAHQFKIMLGLDSKRLLQVLCTFKEIVSSHSL